jgi:fatty acid desaturase
MAVVAITDMATAVVDRTVVDMAPAAAVRMAAVVLMVAVVARMVAAVVPTVVAVTVAVVTVAVVTVAVDMVAADTSKRQLSSQSAHHARSGGAYRLRRFAFANSFYRSSSSSVVLKSVFSSRYLTITGA